MQNLTFERQINCDVTFRRMHLTPGGVEIPKGKILWKIKLMKSPYCCIFMYICWFLNFCGGNFLWKADQILLPCQNCPWCQPSKTAIHISQQTVHPIDQPAYPSCHPAITKQPPVGSSVPSNMFIGHWYTGVYLRICEPYPSHLTILGFCYPVTKGSQ